MYIKGIKLIEILDKLNIDMSKEKTVGGWARNLNKFTKMKRKLEDIIDKVKMKLFKVINKSASVVIEKIDTRVILGKCPVCGGNVIEY